MNLFSASLVCLLFGILSTSFSKEISWKKGNYSFIDIGKDIYILEDSSQQLTIDQVCLPSHEKFFIKSDKSVLNFGFTNSAFWLKISINNNSKDSLLLNLGQPFIPYADLYVRNALHEWISYKSGYKVSLIEKPVKHHSQSFPLLNGSHDYYIRIIPYIHPVPVRIWNSSSFQITTNKENIIYGIYIGILIFVIALHLFLYITLKAFYYLAFSILIFSYMLTSLGVLEGYIIYLTSSIDMMYFYKIVPIIDMPILLIYCTSFLSLKKLNKKLYNINIVICIFFIFYLISAHFLPLFVVLFSNWILALLDFLLACLIGIYAGKTGNKLGYYYTVAYLLWFILILLEESHIRIGFPPHIFQITYVSFASLSESFFLAILLAKRLQIEKTVEEEIKFNLQKEVYEMQKKFDREIFTTQIEIQNQTLTKVGQDLHDNIGQLLAVSQINLSILEEEGIEKHSKFKNNFLEARNIIVHCIEEVRSLSKSLNGNFVKNFGLIDSIKNEVNKIKKTSRYQVHLSITGNILKQSYEVEIIIFRTIQEIINNILKHANAQNIDFNLVYHLDSLEIRITDDGNGFDYSNALQRDIKSSGSGLRNIDERIQLVGGQAQFISSIGKGTKVILTIPL